MNARVEAVTNRVEALAAALRLRTPRLSASAPRWGRRVEFSLLWLRLTFCWFVLTVFAGSTLRPIIMDLPWYQVWSLWPEALAVLVASTVVTRRHAQWFTDRTTPPTPPL